MSSCQILILGTGSFAARIVYDIAAVTAQAIEVTIAGRNAERLDWLVTAANARAAIFACPAHFRSRSVDMSNAGELAELLNETRPDVVVQAASPQASAVIAARGNAWTQLIADAGPECHGRHASHVSDPYSSRHCIARQALSPDQLLIP